MTFDVSFKVYVFLFCVSTFHSTPPHLLGLMFFPLPGCSLSLGCSVYVGSEGNINVPLTAESWVSYSQCLTSYVPLPWLLSNVKKLLLWQKLTAAQIYLYWGFSSVLGDDFILTYLIHMEMCNFIKMCVLTFTIEYWN